MISSIMAKSKQTLLLSLLLALVKLISLPALSCQEIDFTTWVRNQSTNPNKDVGCVKTDAILSSAEANKVHNSIDPTSELGPEDGNYKTISEAIANIPEGNTKRYVLILQAGAVFREKLFLGRSKPFVTIRSSGDPNNPAVIVWNDTATTPGKDGRPLGVDNSSTVTIESDYFIANGVVFQNDAPLPKLGENKGEAPALRLLGTKAIIYNCTIDGGQGALYDQNGLHYFKSSIIKGTLDFIFGSAKSFYEDCNIVSVNKEITALPMAPLQQQKRNNPIKVAPGGSGFSFKTCTFKGDGTYIYLGRVGTPFVFSYTQIDKQLIPLISNEGRVLLANNRYHLRIAHLPFF
jgi:pectinesterase